MSLDGVIPEYLRQLRSAPSGRLRVAIETLLTYGRNLAQDPANPKFRRIRLGNMTFQDRVFQVPGGEAALLAMGFSRDGEFLSVAGSELPPGLSQVMSQLAAELARSDQTRQPEPRAPRNGAPQQRARADPGRREGFRRRIVVQQEMMRVYEGPDLQRKARDVIPMKQLLTAALQRKAQGATGIRDCLLIELLAWFKRDFFSWVNSIPCDACGGETEASQNLQPTAEERRYHTSVTEGHRCKACGAVSRFPRYNDPGKLLETRRGRCGEWTNCFVACARALAFDTRTVVDFTDHVWAEVYSCEQKRYMLGS